MINSIYLVCFTIFLFLNNTDNFYKYGLGFDTEQKQLTAVLERGIIYISTDAGRTYQNISHGLPDNIFLTDLVINNSRIGISTKQHGIYIYDLQISQWKKIQTHPPTTRDVDALMLDRNTMYTGTQGDGVYISTDEGLTWQEFNNGLENLVVRKLDVYNDHIYAATNGGLFKRAISDDVWTKEFDDGGLQVNGITFNNGVTIIGSNKGVYKKENHSSQWTHIFKNKSLHNVSQIDNTIYGMVYNEMFISSDGGHFWQNFQQGIPPQKYTFQVVQVGGVTYAGQWDGIYRKDQQWVKCENGLPDDIAITEMKSNENIVIAASSQWWQKNCNQD